MPAAPKLEFFYDCSSPWSYFAFTRIIPMAEQYGLSIVWRPILVGGVFNAVNQELYAAREAMFSQQNNPRVAYYLKDLNDWARLCNVTAIMPAGHPISAVKAMRGAIFADDQGLLVPYSRNTFATYWGGGSADISCDEVLRDICRQTGLPEDAFFSAIAEQSYKDRLRANTDALIARGGYGSPTVFINDDDMYFGNDRLPLVFAAIERLQGRA